MDRREFMKGALTATAAGAMWPLSSQAALDPTIADLLPADWSNDMPPLFCTAYIDPTIPDHKGQEGVVAKFPVALVGQDTRLVYRQWRDRVRKINPSTKLFGYQQVNSENFIPGIGHDILRKINNNKDVWITWTGGITPTAFSGRRLYDPRNPAWQEAFLDACVAVYNTGDFDGLFLDNCGVFSSAAPIASVRASMTDALSGVLDKLRKRLPNAIILGNAYNYFPALNGKMNEGRPNDLASEMSRRDNKTPIINMFQYITDMKNPDMNAIKANLALALRNKCYFGLAHTNDYQHMQWPALFDEVVEAQKHNPPKKMAPPTIEIPR
jgi:hypothetical protein